MLVYKKLIDIDNIHLFSFYFGDHNIAFKCLWRLFPLVWYYVAPSHAFFAIKHPLSIGLPSTNIH